jgi:acetyl-CoA carboxylase beta subunit
MTERGQIIGHRVGGESATETEHFYRCPACGALVDERDLMQVLRITNHCRTRKRISRNE